ncbi:MAG: ankyrin repeat domain-containing protein [Clostridia bacterium]|nr:ankyrin repeat domain-containing protein [Clostridia bacterium]
MMKKLIVLSIISTIGLCFTLFVLNGLHQNDKLFEAIENNDYSAAEKAIERGAWINTRDDVYSGCTSFNYNPTPLIAACDKGNFEIIKLLVENGADVNKKDDVLDRTPLIQTFHGGVNENRYKIAKYLVEKGADIYYQDTHDTVMSLAVMIWDRDFEETRKESFEFVKYLIEHNVDTDCPTGRVRNVFNSAAYYGHNLVVEYLLDEEIYNINSVDELGITALIAAATGGHIETVQMLLTRGADVNIYDSYGKTACDYAIEGNYTEIADLLHFYGA